MSDPMEDLSIKEREEIMLKAIKFFNEHENYIVKLMLLTYYDTPPIQANLFSPDLWSGANWRWFTKNNF